MNLGSLGILAVLALNVALCEWLVRRTFLRHLGTALLVIVVTAIEANAGLIPTYSDEVPVYVGVFRHLAPLAVFWLLLDVHLARVLRAGRAMISLFLVGALGTLLGVVVGMTTVGGEEAFGDLQAALGGMFVATYIGGSVNFIAVALEHDVIETGRLYAGAAAVDSIMTTVWMMVTLAWPRIVRGLRPAVGARSAASEEDVEDRERIGPMEIAFLLALGLMCVQASDTLSELARTRWGARIPSMLILTTLALALAQLPLIRKATGTRALGMFGVYLFLAVIGALCDLAALREIGRLGVALCAFVTIVVLIHGVVVLGLGHLLRADPEVAAVASQANIGGGTSALALARSLGRSDLVVPAILVGALGNALGTYAGFLTVALLD